MNRLLQGDVGSGKTIVALLAMLLAIESGFQAAIMVPTEILAEQHYLTMQRLVEPLGVRVMLLTSAIKGSRRRELLETIAAGDVDLLVGTHALIQEGLEFKALGLAVIDEQHRFGVLQRATLKRKGYSPDVLVMTATPIPRTLAMTVYGDLEVSIIDELPPGRLPVITSCATRVVGTSYELMRQVLRQGRQVYVVYPLIEESENRPASRYRYGRAAPTRGIARISGGITARAPEKRRERAHYARFFSRRPPGVGLDHRHRGGVDVPNATLMLVEHAERFGLAQLHQLRGRVGRSHHQAYCLLMADFPMSEEGQAASTDSDRTRRRFYDRRARSGDPWPGNSWARQSGLPELRVAHLIRDQRVWSRRAAAFALVASDPLSLLNMRVSVRRSCTAGSTNSS